MSNEEVLIKIEKTRNKLLTLATQKACYSELLKVSQELDKYIAQYQRIILHEIILAQTYK